MLLKRDPHVNGIRSHRENKYESQVTRRGHLHVLESLSTPCSPQELHLDRFFGDCDPENCDEGDFYGDEAQMLWCSVDCYLRLLSALGIRQDFISVEKLEALATAHFAGQFPNLLKGIVTSTREALNP